MFQYIEEEIINVIKAFEGIDIEIKNKDRPAKFLKQYSDYFTDPLSGNKTLDYFNDFYKYLDENHIPLIKPFDKELNDLKDFAIFASTDGKEFEYVTNFYSKEESIISIDSNEFKYKYNYFFVLVGKKMTGMCNLNLSIN